MRSIVFVLWLLAAPAVFAQEDRSARHVLDECIESVGDDVVGMITPFMGLGMDDFLMVTLVSGLLIGVLMNVLVTPFFSGLLIAMYWDLKLRKEGGDLAARVGALNAA